MARVNISNMEVGQTYTNVFILKQHTLKNTKSGSSYLDMVIQDKSGEMPLKLWAIPAALNVEELKDSDYIVLQFMVEDYQGNKQGKVLNIRTLRSTDVFNREELIPMAPEPPEAMFSELMSTALGFSNFELKKLVTTILEENKTALMTMPGAKSMHHDVVGGLLYHTTGMLRTAKALSEVYPSVKKELLCAGVILHDICKLKEFEQGPVGLVVDYTPEGKLLGHINMGAKYVGDKCDELGINNELNMIMQHMILSHHGIPEHGSAIRPMFLEAELLHLCDMIDARVFMFNDAIKDIDYGEFSPKVFGLDNRQIYKFKWDSQPFNTLTEDGIY